MTTLARGDVVLVAFPFTNLSGVKVRPGVVVNVSGDDVLLAFISSVVPSGAVASTEFVLDTAHPDFPATGLKMASVFKLGKLACLSRSLIRRKLGHLTPGLQGQIDVRLAHAVGLTA